jgi:hypothetical protein
MSIFTKACDKFGGALTVWQPVWVAAEPLCQAAWQTAR